MRNSTTAAWLEEANQIQPIREAYFRLVADPKDWKAPIDAKVPKNLDLNALQDAIVHFTATEPTFVTSGDYVQVKAAGYRAGPAGP